MNSGVNGVFTTLRLYNILYMVKKGGTLVTPTIYLLAFFLNPAISPKKGENAVQFWQRQNKEDKAIGLYCQSCCYRYPDECLFIDTLHPYDRSAETCPDFVPKDMYKGKSRAKYWKKRLEVEPDYSPLPDCLLWHPYYFPALCNSTEYFMIMTKEKVYRKLELK